MPTLGGVNSKSLVYKYTSEVSEALTKIDPVDILTSGKITKIDIGKTVYLSNSAIACQEWRIADVNHDNTSGTVDLFPKYVLQNYSDDGILYHKSILFYTASNLRTYLNTTVLNGFTAEIQNAMKVQAFPSNGETLYDKVKCPSLIEVGCNSGSMIEQYGGILAEGTIYPIFGTEQTESNLLAMYRAIGSVYVTYWTRSNGINGNKNVWCINTYGNSDMYSYNNKLKCIACIRF